MLTAMAVGLPLWISGNLRSCIIGVSREGIAPYEILAARVSAAVSAWRTSRHVLAVQSENSKLREQIDVLESSQKIFGRLEEENRALRRQLGFSRSLSGLVPAEVLSVGGSDGWTHRIRISKGRRHGVYPECPVLAPQGLVGRVVEATPTTADVLLITDVNSQLACAFDPDIPSARGILQGGGLNLSGQPSLRLLHTVEPLCLTYLGKDVEIPEKARVVTSGLGGVYPRGLPVGVVLQTQADVSGLFQRSEVAPFVDFSSLRYVAVLVGFSRPQTGRAHE